MSKKISTTGYIIVDKLSTPLKMEFNALGDKTLQAGGFDKGITIFLDDCDADMYITKFFADKKDWQGLRVKKAIFTLEIK